MKLNRYHWIILSGSLFLGSCSSTNPLDPYEPYNRAMFGFNDAVDTHVLEPVAKGYRAVTPSPVRTGVSNVFDNLRDVISFGSNLLRLDIEKASIDLMRVGINTTFGLGGLLNIADAGQMPNHKNTLGDTFASWGWKNSNYFIFPLSGPSTVRDTLGSAVTQVYYPEKALIQNNKTLLATGLLKTVNGRSQWLDLKPLLNEAALDKYSYTRDFYMNMRAKQTGGTYNATEYLNIDDLVDDTSNQADPALDIDELVDAAPIANNETQTPIVEKINGIYPVGYIHVEILPLETLEKPKQHSQLGTPSTISATIPNLQAASDPTFLINGGYPKLAKASCNTQSCF